jgi:phosphoglycolate phosphatase-like HAD superfamily hydrolase
VIAILDIDGVLADASHRQHLVDGRPKDWDAFFAAVGADPPIPAGLRLARDLAASDDVVLLSGRPERTRADTEAWLRDNAVPYARLILRPDADRRPADRFKATAIAGVAGPAEVTVVVDDDDAVVAILESLGYRAVLFR